MSDLPRTLTLVPSPTSFRYEKGVGRGNKPSLALAGEGEGERDVIQNFVIQL